MPLTEGYDEGGSPLSILGMAKRISSRFRSTSPPLANSVSNGGPNKSPQDTIGSSKEPTKTCEGHLPATRSYSEDEWEKMKKVIKYLYLDVDMPLEDVVNILSSENDFHTNVRMCKRRLQRWNFTKNSSKHRRSTFRQKAKPERPSSLLKWTARRLKNNRGKNRQLPDPSTMDTEAESTIDGDIDDIFGLGNLDMDITCDWDTAAQEPVNLNDDPPTPSMFQPSNCTAMSSDPTSTIRPFLQNELNDEHRESDKIPVNEITYNASNHASSGAVEEQDPNYTVPLAMITEAPIPKYERCCPYRYGEKKFRLIQESSDGRYQGDSLGYGTYIAESDERLCSSACKCRQSHFPSAFAFVVELTTAGIKVDFMSESLWAEVMLVLPCFFRSIEGCRSIDGRILFRNRSQLTAHLENLYETERLNPTYATHTSRSLELELLVHGFLEDNHYRQYDAAGRAGHDNSGCYPLDPDVLFRPRNGEADHLKKLRAEFKDLQGHDQLEFNISRLDDAFRMADRNLDIHEMDPGNMAIRYELIAEDSLPSPNENSEAMSLTRWEEDYLSSPGTFSNTFSNTSRTTSSDDSLSDQDLIQGPIYELCSRELRTREEFDASRVTNVEKRPPATKGSTLNPEMIKKLLEGTFSVNDWIMSAVANEDIGLVQSLLELGTDTDVYSGDGRNPPICIAAELGDIQIVRALIDRGAAVDKTDSKGRSPLHIAAAKGHREIVRLILDSDWPQNRTGSQGSLLNIASACGHHEIVQLLLNRRQESCITSPSISSRNVFSFTDTDMQEALVSAAESGSSATMQLLLENGSRTERLLSTPGIEFHSTLIGASEEGNYDVVNVLLQTSVDVNSVDHRGTALSVAISNGHDAVARLLLIQAGGQVLSAIRHLRSCGKRTSIQRLLRIVPQVQRHLRQARNPAHGPLVSTNMDCLRKHFYSQHSLMIAASSISTTKFKDLSWQLSNRQDAWAAGIKMMRKLCRGGSPSTVAEVIPFLCLSRSMVDTLQELHHGSFAEEFDDDLPRWQMIFTTGNNEQELEAYRDAVWSIWGVTCDALSLDVGEAVPKGFQDLASALASKADLLYGDISLGAENKLITKSTRRSKNTRQLSNEPLAGKNSETIVSENNIESFLLQEKSIARQLDRPPDRILAEEIRTDATIIEPPATLLIAGTIFAIFIIFMQVISNVSKLSVSLRVAFPSINTLTRRYELLDSELVRGHRLVHVEGINGNNYCVI